MPIVNYIISLLKEHAMELDMVNLIQFVVCPQDTVYSFYDWMKQTSSREWQAQLVCFYLIVAKK